MFLIYIVYIVIGLLVHGMATKKEYLYSPAIIVDIFFWPILLIVGIGQYIRNFILFGKE